MNRYLLGAVVAGVAGVLAGGCVKDPTASLRNNAPVRLAVSNRYITVNVGDSLTVSVLVLDGQGNQLGDQVTVSTLDAATVTTTSAPASTPMPRTNFFAKAKAYGTGRIEVSLGSLKDTIRVTTFPASARIAGQTDTLLGSGNAMQLTAQPLSATGVVIAGVSPITWSSSNTSVAVVDVNGLVTGQAQGIADITLTVPGATTKVSFVVVPGVFGGTLSASSGVPGDIITITKAASGPVFDADTRVFFRGVRTFIQALTANTLQAIVPGIGATGAVDLLIDNMGPAQVAQKIPFTSSSASLDDKYEPANDDPTTAPVAVNGDQFIILHGKCTDGVFTDPGDDCDDFFTITNSTGATITVTANIAWFFGPNLLGTTQLPDIDLLWCNAACSAYVGNFNGATAANPEASTITVAAGITRRLYLNLYTGDKTMPGGGHIVRVRVSGLP